VLKIINDDTDQHTPSETSVPPIPEEDPLPRDRDEDEDFNQIETDNSKSTTCPGLKIQDAVVPFVDLETESPEASVKVEEDDEVIIIDDDDDLDVNLRIDASPFEGSSSSSVQGHPLENEAGPSSRVSSK
jgi:hypothetical protein